MGAPKALACTGIAFGVPGALIPAAFTLVDAGTAMVGQVAGAPDSTNVTSYYHTWSTAVAARHLTGVVSMLNTIGVMLILSSLVLAIARYRAYNRMVEASSQMIAMGARPSPITPVATGPSVADLLAAANRDYDEVRNDIADKRCDLDYQIDNPDLFRTTFPPAAAFYEQFEDTKMLASACLSRTPTLETARKFAEAAKRSRELWEHAVAESITAVDEGTTTLSTAELTKLAKARGLILVARDSATSPEVAESYWQGVAKLLAQLNLAVMTTDARAVLQRGIDDPAQLTDGRLPQLAASAAPATNR